MKIFASDLLLTQNCKMHIPFGFMVNTAKGKNTEEAESMTITKKSNGIAWGYLKLYFIYDIPENLSTINY